MHQHQPYSPTEKEYSAAMVQFVEKILQEKGVEGLGEEERLQLRNNLLDSLQNRINGMIIEALTPTQLAEFEHLIDTDQLGKLQDYLISQGINVQGIAALGMSEFRARYLGV